MINFIITIISLLHLISINAYANNAYDTHTHTISEVFIEASGNNKYEAKIKAHALGMRRAILLIANKLNIPSDNIGKIPYNTLKSTLQPSSVLNEISLLEQYNATVNYTYQRGALYKLLWEYGDIAIDDLFYEALVIPVFKQRKLFNIWNEEKKWNDFWHASRSLLRTHKILLPNKTMFLEQNITADNLYKLKYEDFIEIFHDKFFKSVVIITAEFFTNRRNADSILHIQKHTISPHVDKAEISKDEYNLSSWAEIPQTIDILIDKIIDDHGALRDASDDSSSQELFDEEPDKKRPIIMNFDVFDAEELDLVISKLEQVEEIESFAIEHDYNNRYKILIYTNLDEYSLAEGLYRYGLSYKIHGTLYNLIDIKQGG